MTILEMWRRITATRYTRALEAEVSRLRAENRALLNSVLGIAGIPPIVVEEDASVGARHAVPDNRAAAQSGYSGAVPLRNQTDHGRTTGDAQVAAPMRRRSWQQITRMLEFESARKTVASD